MCTIAGASGSISAARGRKEVGERVWMWWLWMYFVKSAAVGEEEEGRK